MSLLLIRSSIKLYRSHQLNALCKTTTRALSLSHENCQKLKSNESSIVSSSSSGRTDVSTDVRPLGERVKENTKTASYFGVIVFGVAVTGALFFAIFRELLSSSSPNNIYSDALKICVNVSTDFLDRSWYEIYRFHTHNEFCMKINWFCSLWDRTPGYKMHLELR